MRLATLTAALLTLLLATPALANEAMDPEDFQVRQEGPDVVFSAVLHHFYGSAPVEVHRDGLMVALLDWEHGAPVETWTVCLEPCGGYSDGCVDCDGDGVDECDEDYCEVQGLHERTEICVPAEAGGSTTWTWTAMYANWELDSQILDVAQVHECQVLEVGDDDDACGDDEQDGATAASCAVPGSGGAPLALGLLMAGIGLFGLLAGRQGGSTER